jgi:hypothetical protein
LQRHLKALKTLISSRATKNVSKMYPVSRPFVMDWCETLESTMGAPSLHWDLESATRSNGDTRVGPSSVRSLKNLRIQEHNPDLPDNYAAEDTVGASATFTRTKALISAAVRLWELKRGIGY